MRLKELLGVGGNPGPEEEEERIVPQIPPHPYKIQSGGGTFAPVFSRVEETIETGEAGEFFVREGLGQAMITTGEVDKKGNPVSVLVISQASGRQVLQGAGIIFEKNSTFSRITEETGRPEFGLSAGATVGKDPLTKKRRLRRG